MAQSESHTLGEFIGNFFEELMKKPIKEFADKNHLFFDSYGYRTIRGKDKITWEDINGSHHNLDYVLEEGGTDNHIGQPVAFIELAWRRYTKHSKNKVQEIQSALDPICEKYKLLSPFKGVILCGVFTQNSLKQLKNDHFHILFVKYSLMVNAFKKYGFDISYDETTSEEVIKQHLKPILSAKKTKKKVLEQIGNEIVKKSRNKINAFIEELNVYYNKKIISIRVLPLYGVMEELNSINNAINYIAQYSSNFPKDALFQWFELSVLYNTGSKIDAKFKTTDEAIRFLKQIQNI